MALNHLPVSLQSPRIGGEWIHQPDSSIQSLPLVTVGIKTYDASYRLTVENYDIFQVQLILAGTLLLSLPTTQTVALQPGSGVFYRLGSAYQVSAECETQVFYITLCNDLRPAFAGKTTAFDCDDTMDGILSLLRTQIEAEPVNSWLIAALGESLIAHANFLQTGQRIGPNRMNSTEEMVTQAQVILGANAHTGLTPQDLLKTIGISYRHLARLFKQQTGRSPKRFQIEARIGAACRMLESGKMTVSEVAAVLNFSSPQYFARQFRQVRGLAPCDYLADHGRQREQPQETD